MFFEICRDIRRKRKKRFRSFWHRNCFAFKNISYIRNFAVYLTPTQKFKCGRFTDASGDKRKNFTDIFRNIIKNIELRLRDKQLTLSLTDDAKDYLAEIYGDVAAYITNKIEAEVNISKIVPAE